MPAILRDEPLISLLYIGTPAWFPLSSRLCCQQSNSRHDALPARDRRIFHRSEYTVVNDVGSCIFANKIDKAAANSAGQ
jgi:3D (Asp-Asp-Asp) domain-containing protein